MSVTGAQLLRRGTVQRGGRGRRAERFELQEVSLDIPKDVGGRAALRIQSSPSEARAADDKDQTDAGELADSRGSGFESVATQSLEPGMADQIRPFRCVASHRCSNRSFDPNSPRNDA